MVTGFHDGVVALLGLGFEFLMDTLSSILVLWRFKPAKKRRFAHAEDAEKKKKERDARRENNAVRIMGVVFLVLALYLAVKSVTKLAREEVEEIEIEVLHTEAVDTMVLSLAAGVGCISLAMWKTWVARGLGSSILLKDAICTWLGSRRALALIATLSARRYRKRINFGC